MMESLVIPLRFTAIILSFANLMLKKAHIYTKVNSQWELDTTFNVTEDPSERYGISCAIEENTIVIGSGGIFAIYSPSAVGSAYVYTLNNGKIHRLYRIKGGILINQSTENQELEDGIMNIGWAEVANV